MFELASTDVTFDFGTIPNWLMGLAAIGMLILSWSTKRDARKAAALAAKAVALTVVVVDKIEEVRHETNSMRAVIEAAKLQEGRQQVIDEHTAVQEG